MQIMKQVEEIGQACKDAAYLDFDMLDRDGEELLSKKALTKFVNALPKQEKTYLMGRDGYPNSTAYSRMMAAVMLKGYYSANLINFAYRSLSATSALIFNALAYAAKDMEALNDAPDGLDIRDFLASSAAGIIHDIEIGYDLDFFKEIYLETKYSDDRERSSFAWQIAILQHVDRLDDLRDLFTTGIVDPLVEAINKVNTQNSTTQSSTAESDDLPDDIFPKSEVLKLIKVEPSYILPHIYKSKMSCYMRSYWANYGHRFFDKKTCQDFLNDLCNFRNNLNECK